MADDFLFRDYRTEDFPGFLACVRGFYGDGYPYHRYLDRDYIDKKIASGDFILTVAQTPTGEIAAVVAAERKRGALDGSCVLMLRNVLDKFRGQHIASRQLNDLLARIRHRFPDVSSIYADVMTHDCISQSSLVHRGYVLTGLRLMVYLNSIMVPSCGFPPHTKMTQAVFVKAMPGCKQSICLYAPEEHKQILADTYASIGISCTFSSAPAAPVSVISNIEENPAPRYAKTELYIGSAGRDFEAQIENILQKNSAVPDFTYVVYLNMLDPTALNGYRILRENGFYFTGIMPCLKEREYMLLAKTDSCLENFSQISLYDEKNIWIEYIKQHR